MRWTGWLLVPVFVVGSLADIASSQKKPKHLTVRDTYELTKKLRGKYDAPIGWFDDEAYLVFGKLDKKNKAAKSGFRSVHATSGVYLENSLG